MDYYRILVAVCSPLKRGFKKGFNALVSKHIVEIHAIKPSVLQGSA